MKKYFVFAIAALALAFTACDPNTPNNPTDVNHTDVNPTDYVGQKWRIDSAFIDNRAVPINLIVEVLSDHSALNLDGRDTMSYSISGKQIIIDSYDGPQAFDIIKATKEYAHIQAQVMDDTDYDGTPDTEVTEDVYLGIIPESNGEDVALTPENIIGTWKGDYYASSGMYYGTSEWWVRWLPSINYHGLDFITFHADGTLTFVNMLEKSMDGETYTGYTGKWEIKDGKFAYITWETPEPFADWDYYTVLELTTNIFYIQRFDKDYPSPGNTYWDHFSKVK